MKPPLFNSFSRRRRGSFSLVELLVAMTILSLMLIGLATMMGYVVKTWLAGVNSADNFTKARTLLTVLDRDVQMMVLRRDLAAFANQTNGTACAFYTQVQGNPATNLASPPDTRSISLVQYSLVQLPTPTNATSSVLKRLNCGMNFQTNNTPGVTNMTPAVGYTNYIGGTALSYSTNLVQMTNTVVTAIAPENISTGVVAFQWQFIDGTGTILTPPYNLTSVPLYWQGASTPYSLTNAPPYTYTSPPPSTNTPFWYDYVIPSGSYNPRALVVSMVVVSNNAYKLAVQTGTLGMLITNFPSPSTGLPADMPTTTIGTATYATETYAQYWNGKLNPSSGTFGVGLPPPVYGQGAIRVFERHIPLPTNP